MAAADRKLKIYYFAIHNSGI